LRFPILFILFIHVNKFSYRFLDLYELFPCDSAALSAEAETIILHLEKGDGAGLLRSGQPLSLVADVVWWRKGAIFIFRMQLLT
jgi:hypothetical protein